MRRRILLLVAFMFAFCLQPMKAQVIVSDTASQPINGSTVTFENQKAKVPIAKKEHSAKTATIMSACLPGLGQVYNGKWWKVPIVYAGIGGLGYMVYNNNYEYRSYLHAYMYATDPASVTKPLTQHENELLGRYSSSQLQTYKESFRHDFELYTIILIAWYGLNIVDACVDGHLYSYDISDNLSFCIDPMSPTQTQGAIIPQSLAQGGLSFKLNF